MKKIRYKNRLYPNDTQEIEFNQMMGNERFVWNHFLGKEIEQYNTDKTFNFYHKNSKELTELKQELPWLGKSLRDSNTHTLRSLDDALKSASRSSNIRKGFPKFKKKRWFTGAISGGRASGLNLKHVDYDNNKIKIPKVGEMRIKWSRKLPGEIKSWTIKQQAGKWFISFVVDVPVQPPVKQIKSAVGVDFNSKDLAVTSDGEAVPNPKFYAKTKQKLKKAQRSMVRKKKGGSNWRKCLLRVQRLHMKIANQRHNALHQLSHQLIDNNDFVCIEDLNVRAMQRFNGSMIGDAGFGALRAMISYKAELYGKHLYVIDRFAPSTQTCSNCNTVKSGDERMTLSDRIYECDMCGHVMDRDLNAAINILQIGMGSAELTPGEMTSDGGMFYDISSPASRNQESTVREPTLSSNERSE